MIEPDNVKVIGGLQLLISNVGNSLAAPKAAENKHKNGSLISKAIFSSPIDASEGLVKDSAITMDKKKITDEAYRKLNRINRVKQLIGTNTKIEYDKDGKTIKVKTIQDNLNPKAISDGNAKEIEKMQQLEQIKILREKKK